MFKKLIVFLFFLSVHFDVLSFNKFILYLLFPVFYIELIHVTTLKYFCVLSQILGRGNFVLFYLFDIEASFASIAETGKKQISKEEEMRKNSEELKKKRERKDKRKGKERNENKREGEQTRIEKHRRE